MPNPLQSVNDSVKQISALEKGGLFVVLLVVLYMGYSIYLKGQEREEVLIIGRLEAISQQQVNLQQTLLNTQASIATAAETNANMLKKLEGIEDTMVQFVYTTPSHLVLRTPKTDGAQVVKVPLAQEK